VGKGHSIITLYFKVSIQKKPVVYGRVPGRQAGEETMTISTIAVNAASHTGRIKWRRDFFIDATLKCKVNYWEAFFWKKMTGK